jgi:hypothetical protein
VADPNIASDAETERITRLFEALPGLVAGDSDLVRRGRHFTGDFEIGVGTQQLIVSVVSGEVKAVARGPFLLRPWMFAVRAAPATWAALLEPVPAPGVHDILALSKRGLARIEGNLQPFMANLQYVKDMLGKPRALNGKA